MLKYFVLFVRILVIIEQTLPIYEKEEKVDIKDHSLCVCTLWYARLFLDLKVCPHKWQGNERPSI